MSKTHLAQLPPGWRRVLAGAAAWLAFWPVSLAQAQCPPIIPPPGYLPELEPNNTVSTAQAWPQPLTIYGEQTSAGDPDFFRLDGLPPESAVRFTVTPDTFNPRLRIWGLQGPSWVLLQDWVDMGATCDTETATYGGWDPCIPLVPVTQVALQVARSLLSPPQNGHYTASAMIVAGTVPVGDCCAYPLSVGAFPYTDTQNTGASFRDHGFNSSADVWYELVLDQGGTLTAQTCAAATTFDTYIRVIDDDCQTVLDSNDNSIACGVGSTKSWLSKVLAAGTYYVMVEGAGAATGTYQLDLNFITCNAVVPGPGALYELEPNDEWPLAQPWPVWQELYGEQTSVGDPDWFHLLGVNVGDQVTLSVQPDTFDPTVTLYAATATGMVMVAQANDAGYCGSESIAWYYDPCVPMVPVYGLYASVDQGMAGVPTNGHYIGSVTLVQTPVPVGDCCAYPLSVGAFPYTDTQNTGVSFRDHGFNSSADVWYELVLDQGGTLTAQTCAAATTFDTYIRVIDDDCQTVLDSNDNSIACGVGSTKSWLSKVLAAGTYYVMVEGAGAATGTYQLDLNFITCNAVVPGPGALSELEPNDEWPLAQPWPVWQELYGEQTSVGDADWFHVMGVQSGDQVTVTLEPDTFNPVVKAYAQTPTGLVEVAAADNNGYCEPEQLTFYIDPCSLVIIPVGGLYISVTQSDLGVPMQGHYLGMISTGPNPIPVGDCCAYPLSVGALPYTDTQNTGVSFRDHGFNSSADVWYQLVLDQGGMLTAQTCGGQTNFDTYLRVIDDDCATVLASNDNSLACGVGSTQSWLSTCLTAGTYYVMVEGAGSATGTYTLNLALRPSAGNAGLVVGAWGRLAESWHQRYTSETSTLWLLADDPCGQIDHVSFFGRVDNGPSIPLGTDWDGWEPAVATTHEPTIPGDGWFLDFEPDLLRDDPGPVSFLAELTFTDGSIRTLQAESWYSCNLDESALIDPLEYWEVIHDDHFTLVPATQPGPFNLSLGWKLKEKEPEWRRDVPPEWQRPISDTHCVPTSVAACLEWLDATYGTDVCGGLSGDALITALGGYMGTNINQSGTTVSDAGKGLQNWIDDHGGGYTVHTDQHGDVDDMQGEGEGQGQDVIVILRWNGGGSHAVTLSSFMNVPNANGTFTVDFMDPWTGTTQEGEFDPATGSFSGYGDSGDSGEVGQIIYVCPAEAEPGDGGGGGGGSGWTPFQGPTDIPVPPGLWWLKMTFLDSYGKATDLWNIVERVAPVEPVVQITLEGGGEALRLHWEAVPSALAYRIYRNHDGYFNPTGDPPYATVTGTSFVDPVIGGERWCYRVTTVYAQ